MRKFYLLLSSFFICGFLQAQIVNIPDGDFAYYLLFGNCVDSNGDGTADSNADFNGDGELQVSEAEAIQILRFFSFSIQSFEGIQSFINLEEFECNSNPVTSIDLSQNVNLKKIIFRSANLTSLDVSQNLELEYLDCKYNQISSLDLSQNNLLKYLDCSENDMTDISDLTLNPFLEFVDCSYNELNGLTVNTPNSLIKELNFRRNNVPSLDVTNLSLLEVLNAVDNQLSTIDVTQNQNLIELRLGFNSITDIDLTQNTILEQIDVSGNAISEIDLSIFNNLRELIAYSTEITEVDLTQNLDLVRLNLSFTEISNLDISNNYNIDYLRISGTNINAIDVSHLNQLYLLDVSDTPITTLSINDNPNMFGLAANGSQIESLFIKNGVSFSNNNLLLINDMPNLAYICADEFEFSSVQSNLDANGYSNVQLSSYCSFTPGGEFYTIQGDSRIDSNGNGCDINDALFPFMKFNINSSIDSGTAVASESGSYSIPLQEGAYELMPQFENPSYYTTVPTSLVVDFPSDGSSLIQDFCITPNGVFNDLEIVIIPLNQARPGFDAEYKLVYKNKGTTLLSGDINLTFTDDVMDVVSTNPIEDNQALNVLNWNYNDLEPFETREIDFTMNLNTPTDPDFPLNGDDILEFVSTITPNNLDETPEDNSIMLNQTVVNSFDPNDKRCLEGPTITENMVGRYVHYMIRFENTGTANAINVVIKDIIDSNKFDINTLVPLDGSHDFVTRIRNLNDVEFIFENINLPFDDASNDGYVVFKIKTLETLTLGDTFSNAAEIYFDFNFPIITNDYITTVEDNLSVNNPELNASVTLYPNPVNNTLYITSEAAIEKASIFDTNGRLIQTIVFYGIKTQRAIDLETLASGIYVIKLSSEEGTRTQKIIKD